MCFCLEKKVSRKDLELPTRAIDWRSTTLLSNTKYKIQNYTCAALKDQLKWPSNCISVSSIHSKSTKTNPPTSVQAHFASNNQSRLFSCELEDEHFVAFPWARFKEHQSLPRQVYKHTLPRITRAALSAVDGPSIGGWTFCCNSKEHHIYQQQV